MLCYIADFLLIFLSVRLSVCYFSVCLCFFLSFFFISIVNFFAPMNNLSLLVELFCRPMSVTCTIVRTLNILVFKTSYTYFLVVTLKSEIFNKWLSNNMHDYYIWTFLYFLHVFGCRILESHFYKYNIILQAFSTITIIHCMSGLRVSILRSL